MKMDIKNIFDFKHFKSAFNTVVNAIIIKPDDSDIDRAKKIIWYVFFGAILGLIVVSWLIFTALTFSADVVKVPNVKGDTLISALKKLSDRKLVANVTTKFSDSIDEYMVFNQSPSQGVPVKSGRIVTISVSLGSQQKVIPDFTGQNFFETQNYLNKEFPNMKPPFDFDAPIYEFNEKFEKGKIFKQEPKEGTQIKKVKKIRIWVSKGSEKNIIKNLKNYSGKNCFDAADELSSNEINYTLKFKLVNDKALDFIVESQSIPEGSLIETLIKEEKIVVLNVQKYSTLNDEKILGFTKVDIVKKPFPSLIEIKFKGEDSSEKLLLKFKSKGGITINAPYTKANGKIIIISNGKIEKEIQILEEKK